ncbi:unnamed protein product [Brassica oleracea var. botrytis]
MVVEDLQQVSEPRSMNPVQGYPQMIRLNDHLYNFDTKVVFLHPTCQKIS